MKRLRLRKLQEGHTFMINSPELPGNQCFLEYPDGTIRLVTIKKEAQNFTVLKELSFEECVNLRERFTLLPA